MIITNFDQKIQHWFYDRVLEHQELFHKWIKIILRQPKSHHNLLLKEWMVLFEYYNSIVISKRRRLNNDWSLFSYGPSLKRVWILELYLELSVLSSNQSFLRHLFLLCRRVVGMRATLGWVKCPQRQKPLPPFLVDMRPWPKCWHIGARISKLYGPCGLQEIQR